MSHRIQVQGYTKKGVTVEKDDLDGQALAAFLRRKYRHCAAGYVAAKTGIPEATVKGWLMLRARPCSAHLLALVSAYGLALLSACGVMRPTRSWRTQKKVKCRRYTPKLQRCKRSYRALTRWRHEQNA